MGETSRGDTLRRAIETCIRPDDAALSAVGDLFTADATVWSPNLLATSLAGLVETLALRESSFTDVEIEFDTLDVFGTRGVAEFRVAATFSGPFVVDDTVVIEPNGKRCLLGAAVVADFDGQKITGIRGYFDDASLLEQMIPA
jgi:predicted ester cyclase